MYLAKFNKSLFCALIFCHTDIFHNSFTEEEMAIFSERFSENDEFEFV